MQRVVLLSCAVFAHLLTACSEPAAEKQAEEGKKAADAADAERARQRAIFTDPASAEREVSRILEQWVQVKDGLASVHQRNRDGSRIVKSHVLRNSTPWLVTCQLGRAHITLGPWIDGDRDAVGPVIRKEINRIRLDDELCHSISELVARKMIQIMGLRDDRSTETPTLHRR